MQSRLHDSSNRLKLVECHTVLHTLWITILYTDQSTRSHTYCVLMTTSINMHMLTQLSSEFPTEETCVENRVQHLAALLLSTFFFKTILSWRLDHQFWNPLACHNTHLNYIFTIHEVTVFNLILYWIIVSNKWYLWNLAHVGCCQPPNCCWHVNFGSNEATDWKTFLFWLWCPKDHNISQIVLLNKKY